MAFEQSKQRNPDHQAQKTANMLLIGFVLSLTVAFTEGFFNIIYWQPKALSSIRVLLSIVFVTFIFIVILWAGLSAFLKLVLSRFKKWEPFIQHIVPFALFLGLMYVFASSRALIHFSYTVKDIQRLFFYFLLSLFISITVHFGIRKFNRFSQNPEMHSLVSLALPVLSAELLVFAWIHFYSFGPGKEPNIVLSLFLTVLFLVITLLLLAAILKRVRKGVALTVFGIFFIGISVYSLFTVERYPKTITKQVDFKRKIKHVILLSVDTLRPDYLSCFGGEVIQTPNIDKLAEDSYVFTNAVSPTPWTLPSFASIMTGFSPDVHLTKHRTSKLPDTLSTLAEILRNHGYQTAAVGFNVFLSPEYNLSNGFHYYNFFPKPLQIGYTLGAKFISKMVFPYLFHEDASTQDLTAITLDWIKTEGQKDFFLWLHYFDPHVPYEPPSPFLPRLNPVESIGTYFGGKSIGDVRAGHFSPDASEKEWIQLLYASEIRYVDDNIGQLIRFLKEKNIYDEALIVFLSDHAEEFWDHHGFEHGHTLYRELLWVPLFIKLPKSSGKPIDTRQKIDRRISTQNTMATILDLTDIPYSPVDELSPSLTPLLSGKIGMDDQPIFSSSLLYYEDRECVYFDEMKYIRFLFSDREELYDLKADPFEKKNLAALKPGTVRKAEKLLDGHLESSELMRNQYGITKMEQIDLDAFTVGRLRSLGYVR